MVIVYMAILLFILAIPALGTIGPAWEGTKSDRSLFWFVFVPCLALLLIIAYSLGKLFGR